MSTIDRSRADLLISRRVRLATLCVVGALLLCHGVFGALHLCSSGHAGSAESYLTPEHHTSPEAGANTTNEHAACHLMHAANYYAVVVAAFLGLVFGLLLLKGLRLWR